MTSAASNYHESTQFIHQRYEDTAHIIFQQQQKSRQDEKRRQQQAKAFPYSSPAQHPSTNQQPELSRFGNQPVVTIESTKPSKPEDKKSVKTQEIARAEIARAEPPVKSSSNSVDGVRPKRRSSRRHSQMVVCLETTV